MAGWIVAGIRALVVAIAWTRPAKPGSSSERADRTLGGARGRLALDVIEFTSSVREAIVVFDAPVPDGPVANVLRDLMFEEALRVLHEKRRNGLPLGGVETVRVFGICNGARVDVGAVDVTDPEEIPDLRDVALAHTTAKGDPFRGLTQSEMDLAPKLKDRSADDGIPPLGEMLRFSERVDAGLRLQSIDPATVSIGALAQGLFQIGGYHIRASGDSSFVTFKDGVSTYVAVVRHIEGGHPELQSSEMMTFTIDFQRSGSDRGLLITDKYGPFDIYAREKRAYTVRYIPRERLQAFVDSFAFAADG